MLLKDLVIRDVVSIDVNKDILDALTVMFRNKERILPVFSDSKFVGTIDVASYVRVLQDLKGKKPESIRVSEIMDKKPHIITPTTSTEHIIDRLCDKGVYGLPVVSGHDFVGMIKREHVLKRFLPTVTSKFKVMDVMSYNVSTNSIHDTLEAVGRKMLVSMERRIVIIDQNRVEGTISIQDLANVLLAEKIDLSGMSVKDILIPNPVTVSRYDDAAKAVRLMLEWGVGGIPVVDKELEGIVRDKDIIQRLHCLL